MNPTLLFTDHTLPQSIYPIDGGIKWNCFLFRPFPDPEKVHSTANIVNEQEIYFNMTGLIITIKAWYKISRDFQKKVYIDLAESWECGDWFPTGIYVSLKWSFREWFSATLYSICTALLTVDQSLRWLLILLMVGLSEIVSSIIHFKTLRRFTQPEILQGGQINWKYV